MKKKLMFLVAIIAFALCALCGCGYKEKAKDFVPDSNRFILLEEQELAICDHVYILCDRETRVMYLITYLGGNGGGLTVMIDENGKPLLYEGEL